MKAFILYFSGTGNTKFVAEKFDQELKTNGIKTEIHSIEEAVPIEPDTYDYLILGCPKYYEYPTLHFVNYLKQKLPVTKSTIPVLAFCTQTGPLDTNFKGMAKMLARKNHKLIVSKSFPVANNFLIFKSFQPTDEQDAKSRIEQVGSQVKELVTAFLNKKEQLEQVGTFMGGMEHAVAVSCDKLFPAFAMKYSASEECIHCGLCAKMCPKQNIVMEAGKPEFGKHCMF
jgi:flavodoxin